MSKFSYSDPSLLGSTAEEQINNIIALLFKGDVIRVESGDALEPVNVTHNSFLVGSGVHQGFSLSSPLSTLRGAEGAIANRLVTITEHTVIDGLTFRQKTAIQTSII